MAIGDFRLTNSRYVRPGVYIGYIRIPRPSTDPGNPRYPCYIGVGSRLKLETNVPHRRSYVENQQINFSLTPPYQAPLPYAALNEQSQTAVLYKQNREVVTTDKWAFRESVAGSGVFDRVEIQLTEFDRNASYLIDYQSTERDDIKDPLNFDQLRQMVLVGDTEGQDRYREFVDYRIVTDIVGDEAGSDPDALIADPGNAHITGRNTIVTFTAGSATGPGRITQDTTSKYNYDYSMSYELECIAVTPGTDATFELKINPLSGGNSQANKVPEHTSFINTGAIPAGRSITFVVLDPGGPGLVSLQLDTLANYGYLDGIVLEFDFSGGDFGPPSGPGFPGDKFTWDSFGPGLIELSSAHDNTNQFSEATDPLERLNYLTGNPATGSGKITLSDLTDYSGTKDRHYKMQVYYPAGPGPTGDGPSGNRAFNVVWSAWDETPYTQGLIQIRENNLAQYPLTNIHLENGIYVDFDLGAGHLVADLVNDITTGPASNLATALIMCADAQTQYDAHDLDVGPVFHSGGVGQHQTTVAAPTTLVELIAACEELQTLYTTHISDAVMHIPIDDIFTLEDITVSDLATALQFLNDFKAKYNRHRQTVNFVEGDTWIFTAYAARKNYMAKDDRLYTMTVGTVVNTPGLESMAVAWYTDTYEGSFGSFVVAAANPYQSMTDNIDLSIRNFPTTDLTEQFATNDKFNFTTVDEDKIDWSLRTRTTETIPADEVYQDPLGQVTGVPLSWYIILNDTPESVIWVRKPSDGTILSYTIVQDQGENTPYIMLAADPNADVEVKFTHRGREPDPGSIYYVSAQRLRLRSEYEVPVRYLTREEMERGLGPKATDNFLWLAGDIAFDTAFFGAYFCQVRDASGNRVFSTADFRRAIQATDAVRDITDLVVINFYPALAETKAAVERMADPFENSERMMWQGVPIGTPLGDSDTPDTLIYLATKTLQFSGDNPGRGHVVLLGNTSVDRTVVLDDGTVTTVTLDGSFFAAWAAAYNAAFRDPAQTLLRKDVPAFDDMQTWNEKEEILLGAAQILYASSVGGGLFRFNQSTTVDPSAQDLKEISAMNQKIYVTRKVARDMDAALISIVPPSAAAGVSIVRAFLSDELAQIVSSGVIAPYGDEQNPPTRRPINPSSDVYVFVDEQDRTLYHFGYWYNIRYPVKRLYGLFSVDTKFWDSRQSGG